MKRTTLIMTFVATGCMMAAVCVPDRPNISWTDYNTVEDVYTMFKYYKDDSREHIGHEIKVRGWLYQSDPNSGWRYLVEDKDLQFIHDMGKMSKNAHISMYLNEHPLPEGAYDTPLYTTGSIVYDESGEYIVWISEIKNRP